MSIQRELMPGCLYYQAYVCVLTLVEDMTAFIHSRPTQQASTISSASDSEGKEDVTITNTPSQLRKDKRRRVEESLALVDDPASRKGSPLDDLLHPSSGQQVSIQWSQIAYITVRDQVRLYPPTLFPYALLLVC